MKFKERRLGKRLTLHDITHDGNSGRTLRLFVTTKEGRVRQTFTIERRPKTTVITLPRLHRARTRTHATRDG